MKKNNKNHKVQQKILIVFLQLVYVFQLVSKAAKCFNKTTQTTIKIHKFKKLEHCKLLNGKVLRRVKDHLVHKRK